MVDKGNNTYVTVEEASAYINAYYRAASPERDRWEVLSQSDQEALLFCACALLEALPYQGAKAVPGQALAFPRVPFQDNSATEAPKPVQYAQAELALWLADDETQNEQARRGALQKQGVTSFSLGDLSESYGNMTAGGVLSCEKAAMFIKPYLSGGYMV